MKLLAFAVHILGWIAVFGGGLWIKGPAVTMGDYGIGLLVVGIGFALVKVGLLAEGK